jgi:hypothetical protein
LLDDSCQNTSGHAQENVKKVKNWDSEKLLDLFNSSLFFSVRFFLYFLLSFL